MHISRSPKKQTLTYQEIKLSIKIQSNQSERMSTSGASQHHQHDIIHKLI